MKIQTAEEEIDDRPYGGDFIPSLLLWLLFVTLLWGIRFAESIFGVDLYWLGVLPRDVNGLTGIITSPLIHADFSHLFSNTVPLLVLGIGLSLGGPTGYAIPGPGSTFQPLFVQPMLRI